MLVILDIAMPEFSLLFRALDLEMPSERLLARAGGHFVGIPGPAVRARQAALNAVNHQAQAQQGQQAQQINQAARDVATDANLPNP